MTPATVTTSTLSHMAIHSSIPYKRDRIGAGEAPRVLDLFSGCGGFSLGFKSAGYEIVGALEKDPTAARTHALNFFGTRDADDPHAFARDATTVRPGSLVRQLKLDENGWGRAVDVILAGPPCQSYARVGRAKLRAIADNPQAFLHDRRGRLYTEMVRYVRVLKPIAVVFENVPDVLNQAGQNVVEDICDDLEALGYRCRYTTLNAAHYGVPQMRERVFLLAYHSSLGNTPSFPAPSHRFDLPEGYRERNAALRNLRYEEGQEAEPARYLPSPAPDCERPSAVTAAQALNDLPRYTRAAKEAIPGGHRRFTEELPYRQGRPCGYRWLMRNWPGYEGNNVICDHVIRRLPRDYDIFERMEPGDQYPDAHRIAQELWRERMAKFGLTEDDADVASPRHARYKEEMAKVVPPYAPDKFVDKWRKMAPYEPARTLTAHLGKDSYTHIHYDSTQARTISVREAARLQSFPDGFVFVGSMNAAFRQIGNAVPPLLARALALHVAGEIGAVIQDTFKDKVDVALAHHSGDGASGAPVLEATQHAQEAAR